MNWSKQVHSGIMVAKFRFKGGKQGLQILVYNYFIKCIFFWTQGQFETSKGILVNRQTSRGILVLFPSMYYVKLRSLQCKLWPCIGSLLEQFPIRDYCVIVSTQAINTGKLKSIFNIVDAWMVICVFKYDGQLCLSISRDGDALKEECSSNFMLPSTLFSRTFYERHRAHEYV